MVTCWKRSKSRSQARDKVFEIIAISIRHQGANEPHSSGMSLIIKIKIATNRTKVCPPCAACASSPRDKNSLRVSVTNGLLPFEKKKKKTVSCSLSSLFFLFLFYSVPSNQGQYLWPQAWKSSQWWTLQVFIENSESLSSSALVTAVLRKPTMYVSPPPLVCTSHDPVIQVLGHDHTHDQTSCCR